MSEAETGDDSEEQGGREVKIAGLTFTFFNDICIQLICSLQMEAEEKLQETGLCSHVKARAAFPVGCLQ